MPQCSKDNDRISGIPVVNDNLPSNSTDDVPHRLKVPMMKNRNIETIPSDSIQSKPKTEEKSKKRSNYGNNLEKAQSLNRLRATAPVNNTKRKSSVNLILLSASFYSVCYAPYAYTIMLYAFCPNSCGIDYSIIVGVATITVFHGLFNIIVYVLKNKEFKKALVDTFRCG